MRILPKAVLLVVKFSRNCQVSLHSGSAVQAAPGLGAPFTLSRCAQLEGSSSPKAVTQPAPGTHTLVKPPHIHPALLKPNIKIK